MRILINSFRRLANVFGIQVLRLKSYEKLLAYQVAMTRLGIRHSDIEALMDGDKNQNFRGQGQNSALASGSSDSYFKKLNKNLKQNLNAGSRGAGNSIEDNHLAQYNEGRIARMLLQEKLTSLELSQGSKTKTRKPATTRSRKTV